jgi:hypothetical protein
MNPTLQGGDGLQGVVHRPQVQALGVRDLARDVKGEDLALALLGHAVAAGEAVDQQARPGGAVALPHDVLIGAEVLDLHGQAHEGRPLPVREGDDALHLADERMAVRMKGVHDAAPGSRREHTDLSVSGARDRMPMMNNPTL